MGSKPLRIRFDEIDRFIKTYDGVRYLVLVGSRLYDAICNKCIFLISEKGGIKDSINHNCARISIFSFNSLPIIKNVDFS